MKLYFSFFTREHAGEEFRAKLAELVGPVARVDHPMTDYCWREQGLSLHAYEAEGDLEKAKALLPELKKVLPAGVEYLGVEDTPPKRFW